MHEISDSFISSGIGLDYFVLFVLLGSNPGACAS